MTQEALNLAIQLRDTASGYWTENEIPIIEKLIELLAQPEPTDSMGMPTSCGNPLCSPGNHHSLCKLAEQPAQQQEQVCPQKVCWTPYECENGRCTGSEKNEPVGRFNGKFRAGDGKMFFEVEVEHNKALPAVFSAIYTSPPAQRTWVGAGDLEDSNAYLTPPQRTEQPAPAQIDVHFLRQVIAVAIGGLYEHYKDDVLRVFTLDELQAVVDLSESLRPQQVENIYKRAWDMLAASSIAQAAHGIKGGA